MMKMISTLLARILPKANQSEPVRWLATNLQPGEPYLILAGHDPISASVVEHVADLQLRYRQNCGLHQDLLGLAGDMRDWSLSHVGD